MNPLIFAEHLSKSFETTQAVEDLSLSVQAGEIYGLVGSDGAGKTTCLRLLVGVLRPDSGSAFICGFSSSRQAEQARANLGYLSQRFSLYEDLTVMENIRFFAELRGLTRSEWLPRCLEILEFVGLEAFKERRAGQLSGGMKQKLGLASALVTRPRVLLLDEPTTGVDPVTRQDFWQLVIRLVARQSGRNEPGDNEGVAVLLTTPYMDEASRCHRVGFMRKGRLIAEGTPGELRESLQGRILEVRGDGLKLVRQELEQLPGVETVQAFGDKLHLRVLPGKALAVIGKINHPLGRVKERNLVARLVAPTLEDVFIHLSSGIE
jgi:ABC-2 type transport system ATP-binding protein